MIQSWRQGTCLTPNPWSSFTGPYSGPFVVEERVNEVDYVTRTPGHRKDCRLCHINMLKPYHKREGKTETELETVSTVVAALSLPESPTDVCPMESAVKVPNCKTQMFCLIWSGSFGTFPRLNKKSLEF